MRRLFSTRDVHPRDRLAYWQDVACKAFVEIECRTNAGPAFDATIWSVELADIGVLLVETDQCDVHRQPHGIALGTSDAVLLSLQLTGEATLAQGGREAHLSANDFVLYDTTQIYALRVLSGVRQLVLKLPRHQLERRLGPISRYSARPVRANEPLGSFTSGFLGLIPTRTGVVEQLDQDAAGELSQQILDVVALAFRHTKGLDKAHTPSREFSLARLKMAIDQHLADPGFNPTAAASVAGIGVRYANELLGTEGASLERYILDRRLRRCAEALADPRQRGRSIGDIAYSWGFSDASHFSRLFRNRFGQTPRDYRHDAGRQTEGGPPLVQKGSNGATGS